MKSSKPSTPKPTPAPAPPDRSEANVQSAADAQRRKFYGSQRGAGNNLLTGGGGADSPTTAVKFLGNVGR